jgi:ParB family chromosome partitioning protein
MHDGRPTSEVRLQTNDDSRLTIPNRKGETEVDLLTVELSKLQESKTNPRQFYDKKSMDELIASVTESGVKVPLHVRKVNGAETYEVVAGSRRYRAAKAAKIKTVPVLLATMTDAEALELQVLENDQRVDVHPLEQAQGYKQIKETLGLNLEQLATKVGRPVGYVMRRLTLGNLIPEIRSKFMKLEIGTGIALEAARLTPDEQKATVDWMKNKPTTDWFRRQVEETFFLSLKTAPFDIKDAKLVPEAGSCMDCPKRTGANKLLFDDVKGDDTCTDPVCFQTKVIAFVKIQVGTHPDATILSSGYKHSLRKGEKPKGILDWVPTKGKKCDSQKEGILVEKLGYSEPYDQRDIKIGSVFPYCAEPKCEVHSVISHPNMSSGRSEAEKKKERERRIELRRRGMIFKALAQSKSLTVSNDDMREMLNHRIESLSHDHCRAICKAMEWDAPRDKSVRTIRDFRGEIAKQLDDAEPLLVSRWLFLLTAAETELWLYNHSANSRPKFMEEKAKALHIDLAAIGKESKLKKPPTAKPKAKKKKA